jgi:hypothetical protein
MTIRSTVRKSENIQGDGVVRPRTCVMGYFSESWEEYLCETSPFILRIRDIRLANIKVDVENGSDSLSEVCRDPGSDHAT